MEIQPNQRAGGLNATPAAGHENRRVERPAPPVNFEGAAGIDRALKSTPDERPNEVEHAKALNADRAYPPPETIRKLSNLLAMHLEAKSA